MKHMNYGHRILLLLTLTLFACGGKKSADSANADSQNGLVTFHLNAPPAKVEPLLLSEIADSVSYVALETTKETLTKDGIRYGDRYYTIVNEEKLLCFDKGGKYLHQIGRQGQGPEEYLYLFDYSYFNVDPTNNWVYVLSNNCTKVYDENGKYKKSLTGEMWGFYPYFVYNNLAYFAPYFSRFEIIDGSTNQIVRNNKRLRDEMKGLLNELSDKAKKEGKNEYISEGIAPVSCVDNDAVYYWCILLNDTVIMANGKEVKPHCLIIPENKYKP
ncbi:MAG: 6-bladed beta-propeller, partial [Bacteroidales bacterium]|nr:6-bladed beta-propeller [Bacteroidales bacterium]